MTQESGRFPFSNLPNNLEAYECYEDFAQKDLHDGRELLDHPGWDESQKARWHFFYRPIPEFVGRPQQKEIQSREITIRSTNEKIAGCRAAISGAERAIEDKKKGIKGTSVVCAIVALGILIWLWEPLILLPIGYAVRFAYNAFREIKQLLIDIEEKRQEIRSYEQQIRQMQEEIARFQEEIKSLLKQIPRVVSAQQIEKWLAEDIQRAEYRCLNEVVARDDITAETIGKYIRHQRIDERVHGVLIDSWGFLQPSKTQGPFGAESTGLNRVKDDIGRRIASWRVGTKAQPLVRVLYLQYIFLLDRNINVYSFFYDFITREWYGKRCETFQYNHVTSFSIREMEMEAEDWVNQLGLGRLTEGLFGKEINVFTLAVANGEHFRCILVDDQVASSMNDWMAAQQEYEALSRDKLSLDDYEKRVGDRALAERMVKEEQMKRNQMRAKRLKERQEIDKQDINRAREALRQIRDSVEHYQQHVIAT